MRELSEEYVDNLKTQHMSHIFKQHIPPTGNNLRLLKEIKKVVLLREPRQIIESYYRAEIRKSHPTRKEFENCSTVEAWLQTAEKNGLLSDVSWFFNEWLSESERHPQTNLVIDYSQLTLEPQKVINSVVSYFDLPVSETVVLRKERYSRIPVILNHIHRIGWQLKVRRLGKK